MRRRKVALVIGMTVLACIFAMQSFVYAAKEVDGAENASTVEKINTELPNDPADKGSPMHCWDALVNQGLKAGSTFTTADLSSWRNWSDSTVNDEINSLIDLGIIRRLSRGNYEVLVTATIEQIAAVNEQAKPIVNKKGVKNEDLGIDSYKTDVDYLGGEKVDAIKTVIAQVTGKTSPLDTVPQEKVITATANSILTQMQAADKEQLVGLVADNGYTLAIATDNSEEAYINKIVDSFSKPDLVRQFMTEGRVVFSLVKNQSLLQAIEDLAQKEMAQRTLNNLTPGQLEALKGGV